MVKVKYINEKYPLSLFFRDFIESKFSSISHFFNSLDYLNPRKIGKEIGFFYESMKNGRFKQRFIDKVGEVYPNNKEKLDLAIQENSEVLNKEEEDYRNFLEAEYRRTFKPYLFIEHENKVPSQICIYALTGGERYEMVKLPNNFFKIQSTDEQLNKISNIAAKFAKNNPVTKMFGFGKVLGFIFQQTPDVQYKISIKGEILDCKTERYCVPESYVTIK